MKIVEGVASNKDPSLPMQTRKEVPTAMAESVRYSLLPLLTSTKRIFENASPLYAGIRTAKSSIFDIVDLVILQET
jgi:hypothetical protein